MMKTILATTAVAALLAGGAHAQTEPAADDAPAMEEHATDGATTPAEDAAGSDVAADDAMSPADPAMAEEDTMAPADPALTEDGTMAPADPALAEDAPAADPTAAADPMLAEDDPADAGIDISEVSVDRLMGADITTMDDETIASVEDVIITDDGEVESLVAKFGGFLGFGSNEVLLTPDEVTLMEDEDGSLIVQTTLTPESIEDRPEFEG